jgi:alpha-D-ribose 1-methylphosphonate 5-triphosphate synthase subunit PhnG
MATIASRLTSTGTLFISGEFNEVTQSTIRLTTTTYHAAQFDEVSMNGSGSVAKRETNTGTIFVSNGFNEVNKPI